MRKAVRLPIEAFDPRIKDLLLRGSVERVELTCDTLAQRNSLRNQLFNYRARAREAHLPGVDQMYRAKIGLPKTPNKEGKYVLIVAPRGSEFNEVLAGATTKGVTNPLRPDDDPLNDLPIDNREGEK